MREKQLPVGEIADKLKIRQPQVSKHLAVLNKAGLIKVEPDAQLRIYMLSPKPLKKLDIQKLKSAYKEK